MREVAKRSVLVVSRARAGRAGCYFVSVAALGRKRPTSAKTGQIWGTCAFTFVAVLMGENLHPLR
jgi:hypothetical protein